MLTYEGSLYADWQQLSSQTQVFHIASYQYQRSQGLHLGPYIHGRVTLIVFPEDTLLAGSFHHWSPFPGYGEMTKLYLLWKLYAETYQFAYPDEDLF